MFCLSVAVVGYLLFKNYKKTQPIHREVNSFDNPTYSLPPLTTDLNSYQDVEPHNPDGYQDVEPHNPDGYQEVESYNSDAIRMDELEINGENIQRFNTGLAPLENSDYDI